MDKINGVPIQMKEIASFCRRNGIRTLSLFGSIITDRFEPSSDVDILVEFDDESIPGLLRISRMERELMGLFDGRKIDLRTPEDLSRYFRDDIIHKRVVLYAAS